MTIEEMEVLTVKDIYNGIEEIEAELSKLAESKKSLETNDTRIYDLTQKLKDYQIVLKVLDSS